MYVCQYNKQIVIVNRYHYKVVIEFTQVISKLWYEKLVRKQLMLT